MALLLRYIIEEILYTSRNNALSLRYTEVVTRIAPAHVLFDGEHLGIGLPVLAEHCVSLARACLAVGEDRRVEPAEHA